MVWYGNYCLCWDYYCCAAMSRSRVSQAMLYQRFTTCRMAIVRRVSVSGKKQYAVQQSGEQSTRLFFYVLASVQIWLG